jgi:pimeloyl-ACP methyl ester carboxylesterase
MSFMPRDRETALAGGGSVAWREWGDANGDPVVFLHGTPGSRLFSPDTETSVRLITIAPAMAARRHWKSRRCSASPRSSG